MSKSVRIYETGSVDVLKLEDITIEKPLRNMVRVRHVFAGLNFIDVNQRKGFYPLKNLPKTLGMEASGIIESLGEGVKKFKVGDRVSHCMNIGSYSELMNVNENKLIKIPDKLSLSMAAASTLQGLTAHYLINDSYKVNKGDYVLIHSAAGGVGQILSQWVSLKGGVAVGTVGNKNKITTARDCGCEYVILYEEENFDREVLDITKGIGAKVIYDSVGKSTFNRNLNCLSNKGSIVSYGNSSGAIEPFDLSTLRPKSASIVSGGLLNYISNYDELSSRASDLFSEIIKGSIKINVNDDYTINDIKEAHRALESRETTGSIVMSL